jgi:cell division control protein 24
MTTVAGRKKSIVSSGGVILDMAAPVANNNVLNKVASASLYQRCAALRAALLRVRDFPPYFSIGAQAESSRKSTDPVSQLWDCFATGIPLCYLFNLLPNIEKEIECDTDPAKFDNAERTKKHAVAKFIIATHKMSPVGLTVTDFVDRNSTDGFVKVSCDLLSQLPNTDMTPGRRNC